MKIVLIGANGTIGELVQKALAVTDLNIWQMTGQQSISQQTQQALSRQNGAKR
jgi:hypothetical protein